MFMCVKNEWMFKEKFLGNNMVMTCISGRTIFLEKIALL